MRKHPTRRRFEHVPLQAILGRERAPGPLKVLNVGIEPSLLQTRGAILQRAGMEVVNVGDSATAVRAFRRQAFDAVVLCHGLGREHKRDVIEAARRRTPSPKVVALYNLTRSEAAGADLAIDSQDCPEALLRAMHSLS